MSTCWPIVQWQPDHTAVGPSCSGQYQVYYRQKYQGNKRRVWLRSIDYEQEAFLCEEGRGSRTRPRQHWTPRPSALYQKQWNWGRHHFWGWWSYHLCLFCLKIITHSRCRLQHHIIATQLVFLCVISRLWFLCILCHFTILTYLVRQINTNNPQTTRTCIWGYE